VFDTTGIGYFEPGKNVPDAATLTELLKKERMPRIKVTRVAEVELPKANGAFEISISGLG
jgi:hypothetical protein